MNNKPLCVVSCPLETFSGYGSRSKDFLKALIKVKGEEWNIQILSQRWGQTPFGALDTEDPSDQDLKNRIIGKLTLNMPRQPDVFFMISVPNEFQPIGKSNIGVTAGIETTICDSGWIDGCNRMDLVLVSSEHSKKVFLNSSFQQQDQNKRVIREGKIEKPMEVLFEGVDLNKYFKSDNLNYFDLHDDLNSIQEKFCYLFVGHWLSGDFGEDRKNVGYMIKAFLEVFKNKKDKPALILKVSQGSPSIMDRDSIVKKIESIKATMAGGDLPNIYLLHGDLGDDEINCLYNHPKVKAMISFTKGEGFGRPLLEFSIIGKPIIASGWSGQLDFLTPELSGLIGGTLTNVHPSAHVPNMLLKEAQWFKPDDNQVGYSLMDVYSNYKKYKEKARQLAYRNKQNFSFNRMAEKLDEYIIQYIPEFPKHVELVLPSLKRIK